MGEKITKADINGSDLYFLKKLHLILVLLGLIALNAFSLSGLYYSLKSDIETNTKAITHTVEDLIRVETINRIQTERLDRKHDAILELRVNLKNYMTANGFEYIEASIE